MRRLASQFVFSFAVLAVLPLLGMGPKASADHIGAKTLTRPACSPLSLCQIANADLQDTDLGIASSQSTGSSVPNDVVLPTRVNLHLMPYADLLGQSQHTGGFGGGSTGFGANGAGQQVGLTATPSVPELELAGLLFLDSTRAQTRAFPSHTFRPPREAR